MSHLEARLEKDLSTIRERLSAQAERAAKQVADAVHAVQTGDHRLAYATMLGDHPINRENRQIDRLCHSFIAVHLPSAGHLRLLSSVIRANVELERIGDYAVTICQEAVQMSAPPSGALGRELERVSGETLLMLRQSVRAFRELNAELARGTTAIADQIEHDMDMVYEELLASSEKTAIKDILSIFVIFNQLKRAADQAKNLCEHTVFAATGRQKAPKVYNVLFLDRDNSRFGPMAEAIARSSFPKSGLYRTAGINPAAVLDKDLTAFLAGRGFSVEALRPQPLKSVTHQELTEQHVIVCLEGAIGDYLESPPLRTVMLEWELDATPDMEDLYRDLAPRIRDLMELLRGEGAG